ncbi:hypothetical protein [Bradyrhizobium yuanmingense]|uniref:hypothetical protein n=1 Tax=Bradyrhizobium yuanmingense TaxID=108015 RepID=UPI0023B95975|nr:hypothetical protein [Bradyrhizobium yuanmingense]MDF0584912.1 hypothetical protein [Bradyrhizobium yuanmingense]
MASSYAAYRKSRVPTRYSRPKGIEREARCGIITEHAREYLETLVHFDRRTMPVEREIAQELKVEQSPRFTSQLGTNAQKATMANDWAHVNRRYLRGRQPLNPLLMVMYFD